jgi:hypothetical protein
LVSDAFLTTLHPLLESVLQTVDRVKISYLGAPFSWLEKPRNRMERDMDCMADVLVGFHRSTFSKPNTELINTINENTEVLLQTGKEFGLEVNAEKTEYMVVSRTKI